MSSGTAAPVSAEQMVAEARKAFFVMFAFLAVVWAVQLANWAGDYGLSKGYSVISGEPGRLPDILAAPLLHWSWAHIEANSGPLFVFGFLAAYRGVARFFGLTLLVAVVSGLMIWFFESPGAGTAGASGLVFGYFGYVVVRGFFDRHLIDSLVGVVMAASFAYIFTGVLPGTPGVSWLGHLGGLIGGVVGAWVFRDRRAKTAQQSKTAQKPKTSQESKMSQESKAAGSTAVAKGVDGPRSALYKELDDLGLL